MNNNKRQIILDTETTGLEPSQGHRVIEVGCVELINRKMTEQQFHQYLNPQREIEDGAYDVHGLSNEFLADKPLFKDIAQDFLDFIRDAELIIHNAPFDVAFLNAELKQLGKKWGKIEDYCKITDSLKSFIMCHKFILVGLNDSKFRCVGVDFYRHAILCGFFRVDLI